MKTNIMNKSNYNNYTFARGKLGDFLMNIDLAKRINEVDGSLTKIIVFRNLKYLKQIEDSCNYVKVYKINIWILIRSFFDYIFNKYCFIYVAQLDIDGTPWYFKYSIKIYAFLAFILSRGKFFANTYKNNFPFIKKNNFLIVEIGNNKKMQYESNIDLVKKITNKNIDHKPILDFIKDDNYKKFLINKNKKYIVFSLYAGDRSRALDPEIWRDVFFYIKKYNDNFDFIIVGSDNDKNYLDEIFIDNKYVIRMEGKLSFSETCNIFLNSSGIIVGRTGNATLATMLPINIPIVVLLAHIERKWDYDYYSNLNIIRNNEKCLCVEGSIDKCFKIYKDGKKPMCIGELNSHDINNILDGIIFNK